MNTTSTHTLTVSGSAIKKYLPALARLRIAVFRDYPYLYDGSLEYEEEYLQIYSQSDETIFVLIFDGYEVVGASSGMPLKMETEDVKKPFIEQNLPIDSIFYFGESVLLKPYRGQGFGKVFFDKREAHAQSLGYEYATFCGVIRPNNHPLKPNNYKPLDGFWRKRGYEKRDDMKTTFIWQDFDEDAESPKKMQFWMKRIL